MHAVVEFEGAVCLVHDSVPTDVGLRIKFCRLLGILYVCVWAAFAYGVVGVSFRRICAVALSALVIQSVAILTNVSMRTRVCLHN